MGLLFGNLFSVAFSLSGGALSLLVMALVKRADVLNDVGVSIVGGIAHNAGQVVAAVVLVENVRVAYYFIPLAVSGIVAGALVGMLAGILVKRTKKYL